MHFKIFGLSERLQCAISQENHINKNQAETKKSIEEKKITKSSEKLRDIFQGKLITNCFCDRIPETNCGDPLVDLSS